jgi:hypothetical protein
LAKPARRVSGTQICSGRNPAFRIAAQCFCARADVLVLMKTSNKRRYIKRMVTGVYMQQIRGGDSIGRLVTGCDASMAQTCIENAIFLSRRMACVQKTAVSCHNVPLKAWCSRDCFSASRAASLRW